MTVAELRTALEGVPDAAMVYVRADYGQGEQREPATGVKYGFHRQEPPPGYQMALTEEAQADEREWVTVVMLSQD